MIRLILLSLVGFTLYSCQSGKSVLSNNYVAGATFSGTVPCDDCNGISQVVMLDSNNRFRLSETYLGKNTGCKEKCGTWSIQSGKLMLYTDTATIAQYAVAGNNLVYLSEGSSTVPAQGGMLIRKKRIQSKKINPDFLEGLDVVGFGADASWSLDVTHNKGIQFSVAGADAPFAFSNVVPRLAGDSLIYSVNTADEHMSIIFVPGFCGDNTGESLYDYKVAISFRGKTYYGCGAIMNADGGLDGTWVLQQFSGQSGQWTERPYVVIDLNHEKFYGFTGCNRFSGTVRLRQLKVCFSDIRLDGMKECQGYDENALIEALIKCNEFSISEGVMQLGHSGGSSFVFKRELPGAAGQL